MFTCRTCGREFNVRQDILDRYPGWTPQQCLNCRDGADARTSGSASQIRDTEPEVRRKTVTRGRDLTTEEVLAAFREGPDTGVFTDGASEGNPGPGGWGAVHVVEGEIVEEAHGSETYTTNNRMELTALIAGLRMLEADSDVPLYTDSQLVVNIITQWAAGWEARGWKKRSSGPIANLELVQEAYALARERPAVEIRWIKAHSGYRWNEYADALATAYRRSEV